MLKRDNFNQLYLDVTENVLTDGKKSAPRGLEITELLCYPMMLTNPLNCLCTLAERKLNYAFAIIEKLEYLTGNTNPERLCFYNPNLANFKNESTNEFDGAYAPRIKRQLPYIYTLLLKDSDTRQAVININNETDKHDSKDVACTISLQFLIRENKLNLITTMRSNDILWGTPYDINSFCFLQEVMAKWLDLELGNYYHVPGSLHIYETTKDKLRKMLINRKQLNLKNPAWDIDSYEETFKQLYEFWFYENELRNYHFIDVDRTTLSPALKFYLLEVKKYCLKKHDKK